MNFALEQNDIEQINKNLERVSQLCADITREVLRAQPNDLYSFIADYVEALLITREHTKVATELVDHVLEGSRSIVSILSKHGFCCEKIQAVSPKLQPAFRDFLNTMNNESDDVCCSR